MKKRANHSFILVAFGVTLFAALMNLGQVIGFVGQVGALFFPVIIGFLLAFVLNVPMRGFEHLITRMTKHSKRKLKPEALSAVSLLLTILCLLLVIALIGVMLIPELASSAVSLYELVLEMWPEWVVFFQQYDIDISGIAEWVESLNIEQLAQQLLSGAGSLINSAVGVVSSTLSFVSSLFISVIIAVYALLGKRDLSRQGRKLVLACCGSRVSDFLLRLGSLISTTFSKFLSGQCLEACILGGLIFLVFTVLGIPYASLIGLLALVLSFLPYVGSFLACALGLFLVLLAQPSKVLICLIAYLLIQFVENQLIYPHVVGTSVGLSPLWTLIAVLVGGKLMGLFGMIFFIPLTAVVVTLLKEQVNHRLARKGLSPVRDFSERTDSLDQ